MVNFLNELKGGNVGLIARNVASIYVILKRKYLKHFSNRQTLLAAAGIIDAMNYIQANEIEPTQIIAIPRSSSKLNSCSEAEREMYELSSFIRQLETVLFAIDTPIDYFVIRDVVSQMFPVIRETVQEILTKSKQEDQLNPIWEAPTDGFMTLDTMKDIRNMIGI